MTSRMLWTTLMLCAAAVTAPVARAATPTPATPTSAARPPVTATATFAMGCFWCAETAFDSRDGVISVTSGYTGGPEKNPSYQQVSSGTTGHFESIQVVFDPKRTSYTTLLGIFWHNVDPTQSNGQFCDHGRQYRSAIFVHDAGQRQQAEATKKAIEASGVLHAPIVTQILNATAFWPAEGYHQDFWKKDPERYHSYRKGCGRDQRLKEIWGSLDTHAPNFKD